jgi:cell division protease FtsH
MLLNKTWLILLFFTIKPNKTLSFQYKTNKNTIRSQVNKINIKMEFENEYINDLNLLQNSKYYFTKENYNDIMDELLHDKLSKIYIDNKLNQIVTVDNLPKDDLIYNHYHLADINPIVIPNLIEKSGDHLVSTYFVNFTPQSIVNIQNLAGEFLTLASYALPLYFLLSFFSFIYRTNSNKGINSLGQSNWKPGNNNGFNFPNFKNENQKENDQYVKPNVTLSSWAGSPEVIEECKEIISYIENKEKYKEIGAEMPRGILLEGPPGTGKTLLAKAIASETNSSFTSVSGSEFVELFVGMGASRVRDLFESARKNRPSIIFIDEIDAVGRQRGAGINMANDEREQTLNQLLYEMDGFNNNQDIVVMAATNRKDVLDKALLRPGRFDRIIKVPLPDKESREKILEVYINKKKTEKQFDISAIAELTDGFSGAELKNLINEAAIMSARNNETVIKEKYIFDSFEKSIVGLIKKNSDKSTNQITKLRVSLHEAGHALLALKFNEYFKFQKVSIQSTYNGAGGYTIFSEKPEIKEGGLYTKDILKKRLIITMGGKAAESIYYSNEHVSMGAIQDLKQANNLAKRMVGNFGMGDELEVFYNEDVGDESNPFLGRTLGMGDKYSDNIRFLMDKESLNLVKEAFQEAKNILLNNYDKLIDLSNLLQEKTVIYDKDLVGFYDFF